MTRKCGSNSWAILVVLLPILVANDRVTPASGKGIFPLRNNRSKNSGAQVTGNLMEAPGNASVMGRSMSDPANISQPLPGNDAYPTSLRGTDATISAPISSQLTPTSKAQTYFERLKRTTEAHANVMISNMNQMATSIRLRSRQGVRKESVGRGWKTATQFAGGAETPQESTSTASEETLSSNTSDPRQPRAFLGGFRQIQQQSLNLPQNIVKGNGAVLNRVKAGFDAVQKTSSRVGPSFVTALSVFYQSQNGISFLSLFALSLLGSSSGFYVFLYFITTGYTLGIGLPVLVALYVYNKNTNLPRASFLHSLLTVLWSARLFAFFNWREFISWPALHQKVIEIQSRMKISFASKLLCWLVYSFFYTSMITMNWSRLQVGEAARWGLLGFIGLLLQMGGLGIETIADLQKNGFKSRFPHSWCNVGLWKWSTHPNYLGEGMFWWGTYLGHGFTSLPFTILATIGLSFITVVLKGSTRSLATKHVQKYGDQPEFFEFRRTHSIWGPKRWWWWINGMEDLSKSHVSILEGNVTNANSSSTEEFPSEAVKA